MSDEQSRGRWGVRGVLALSMVGVLTGCPSPSTYTTPRTIPPGKIMHSIVVESMRSRFDTDEEDRSLLPMAPTYAIRVGLTDELDVGARLASSYAIGADLKYMLTKGTIDLAVDPGGQITGFSSSSSSSSRSSNEDRLLLAYGYLPLLMGWNINPSISLVGSAGMMFGTYSRDAREGDFVQVIHQGSFARLGLGVDVRISSKIAVHPEVTWLKAIDGHQSTIISGLGVNFGTLPSF